MNEEHHHEELEPSKRWRVQAFVAAVAVSVVLTAGVATYAITHNKDTVDSAKSEVEVVCTQVLKLRDANLRGIDVFEATVKAGYKTDPPTDAEREQADAFFAGQRAVFNKVNCP